MIKAEWTNKDVLDVQPTYSDVIRREPMKLYCPMADRLCDVESREVAWCLVCPHISEEDRDLVKKAIEPKTGKWVGIKEYCDHLNEEAAKKGKSTRYMPSGMHIGVYCDQCWKVNEKSAAYCPNCGAYMVEEEESNGD